MTLRSHMGLLVAAHMVSQPPLAGSLNQNLVEHHAQVVALAHAQEVESCSKRLALAQQCVNEAFRVRAQMLDAASLSSYQPEPVPDLRSLWMTHEDCHEDELFQKAASILRRVELNDIAASGGDIESEWREDPADWQEKGPVAENIHRLLLLQAGLASQSKSTRTTFAVTASILRDCRQKLLTSETSVGAGTSYRGAF